MKKIIIALILVISSINAYSQFDIPKGADKIVIKNDRTAQQNFLLSKQILADNSIEIDKQDGDIHQVKSGKVKLNNYAYYIMLISSKDSLISITGTWANTITVQTSSLSLPPTAYTVRNKGSDKIVFTKMDDFATKFGGKKEYLLTSTK